MNDDIFVKYPKIAVKIKEGSKDRYMQNIREKIMEKREKHIKDINKSSQYKQFKLMNKNGDNQEPLSPKQHQNIFRKN